MDEWGCRCRLGVQIGEMSEASLADLVGDLSRDKYKADRLQKLKVLQRLTRLIADKKSEAGSGLWLVGEVRSRLACMPS